jgi:hypothetical protein
MCSALDLLILKFIASKVCDSKKKCDEDMILSNFCATIYGPICLGFGIALQLCSSFSLLIGLGFWIAFRLEKLEVQTKNQLLDLFFLPSKNSHARTCETLVHRWNSCPMKQMIYELLGNEYYIIENTICAIFLKKTTSPVHVERLFICEIHGPWNRGSMNC